MGNALSSETKVKLTVGVFISCAVTFTSGGWWCAMQVAGMREDVRALRQELERSSRERWSVRDQERWAFNLERANRDKGIVVPDVHVEVMP